MSDSDIHKIIEEFSHLRLDDKEYVAEIMRKQIIESKRERLAGRAQEARSNLEQGKVKSGTIRELMEDLESD